MNNDSTGPLPDAVVAAADCGNKLAAVKRLRESTGIGLLQAKALVDLHGSDVVTPAVDASGLVLPQSVRDAMDAGRKREAIRLLREQTGQGPRDAREAVEVYAASTATGDAALSPGAVAKSDNRWWLVVVLALVAALLYFLFGDAVG
jgi:ribosomal protein L7/L12